MNIRQRIFGLVTATAVAFSATGCSTLNPGTATFLGEIQAFTAQACKFVPTIATIVAIFNAGIATGVGGIATAICASLPPPTSAQFHNLHKYGLSPVPSHASDIGNLPINGWRTQ